MPTQNQDDDGLPPGPLHLTLHGRVQGVGFREGMENTAIGLAVTGWVRNHPDGTVVAVVSGAPEACAAMVRWARRGPLAARVERVDVRRAEAAETALCSDIFRRHPSA